MPTTLHAQLTTILRDTPLLWLSESDYPVEPVSVWCWQLGAYRETFDADGLLQNQYVANFAYWTVLLAFSGHSLRAFRRPSGEPSEYEILIVVREGLRYTGIRTKIVET